MEQQSMASRWRMKNTFFEKNQRKLIEKIKWERFSSLDKKKAFFCRELNNERRQVIGKKYLFNWNSSEST
jgi:hypothetical protein